VEPRHPRSDQQHHPDIKGRIHADVEGIRQRGVRNLFEPRQVERPVDVPNRPRRKAPADRQPGAALGPDQRSPTETRCRTRDQHAVVDPIVEEGIEGSPPKSKHAVQCVREEAHEDCGQKYPNAPGSSGRVRSFLRPQPSLVRVSHQPF
jgi:hypothetical protein